MIRDRFGRRLHFRINTPYTAGRFPGHSDSRYQAAMIGFRTYPLTHRCRTCKIGTHAFVVSGRCVTCTHAHNREMARERNDHPYTLIHNTDIPAKYRNERDSVWFLWTRAMLAQDRRDNGWIWFFR